MTNSNWAGLIVSAFLALIVLVVMSISITNQKDAQHHKFLELQEVLLSNQVAIRDSLIESTQIELDSLRRQLHLYDHEILTERLWLARGIYSETNLPYEQYLVAWVMRNRFDLKYRGCETYKCVVLDPLQFSAFNWNNPSRMYYRNKSITDQGQAWISALTVATEVMVADSTERPFSPHVVNFYSPVSMTPKWSAPDWAKSDSLNYVEMDDVDPSRFRFYAIHHDSLTNGE